MFANIISQENVENIFLRFCMKRGIGNNSVENVNVKSLFPVGTLERLQKYWLAGACKKNSKEAEKSLKLGILNFTSAFILLAGGMLLGFCILFFEFVYFGFFRSRLRKWDKCGCCGLVSLVRRPRYWISTSITRYDSMWFWEMVETILRQITCFCDCRVWASH